MAEASTRIVMAAEEVRQQDTQLPDMNEDSAEKAFQEKVARTVFLQELSPNVTPPVIASALGQFGNVVNIEIVKNPADPKQSMGRALVEMDTPQSAQNVIITINEYLFMLGGIPRPVTAGKATESLFSGSPLLKKKPKLAPRLSGKGDEGWEEAYRRRDLGYKHLKQIEFLAKHQKEEKEKLAADQEEQLRKYYNLTESIFKITEDGSVERMKHELFHL